MCFSKLDVQTFVLLFGRLFSSEIAKAVQGTSVNQNLRREITLQLLIFAACFKCHAVICVFVFTSNM